METYFGFVRTPVDAIKLFEACRLGLLPRVQRRLSEKERQSIRSGSVFVWDEREAGMRRWTDGKSWSASRVSGSFLTYREMEGKRGTGFANTRRSNGRTPENGRISDEDPDGEPEGYRYKADGLMKQSFSITTSQGQHLHLISYYSRPHPGAPDMPQPSSDSSLRHIIPAKGMYPESSLQEGNPPALTRAPMQSYSAANSPTEPPGYAYSWTASPTTSWSGWPPSPSESPHWASHQGKLTPEMKSQPAPRLQQPVQRMSPQHVALTQLPPPPTSAPIHTPPIYGKSTNPFEYERQPTSQPASRHPPAIRTSHYSPQTQHLQLQAQAVMVDPRMAPTSARNPQGPLPSMPGVGPRLTPPRTASVSPPRATSSDGPNTINKASLSALLHPTPASSEPSSANPMNPSSACSSPRAMTSAPGPLPPASDLMREDVKALRSLDRKFCI